MDSLLKQFAQTSQLGANAAFVEDLYEQYLVAPDSVDAKWKAYFDGVKNGSETAMTFLARRAEAGTNRVSKARSRGRNHSGPMKNETS